MLDKHILRKKKDDGVGLRRDLDSDDDEWSRITKSVGEKIEDTGMMDVTARSITFNQSEGERTKEENYKEQSENFKDGFTNTAQYVKFVNAHLVEKKSKMDELKLESEKFERELAVLKPEGQKTKSDLNLINYKDIKSEDVTQILGMLQKEKESTQAKVMHFKDQLEHANTELLKKASQIKEVESELVNIKNQEEVENANIEREEDAVEMLKSQLSSVDKENNNEKIFGAINSLVVLLNAKNQDTVNELNSIKSEFSQMKQEYEETLKKLKEKN